MDVFIEQIVTRKPGTRGTVFKAGIIAFVVLLCAFFLAVFLIFTVFPFISFVAVAAIPGVIWLGMHVIKSLHIEYEYILTNKDLDIDKIKGKSKRRRMITLDLTNAEEFDMYSVGTSLSVDTTVSAHDNSYVNMWYLIVKHKSHGRVALLFNPGDEFIVKLNKSLLPRVRNKKITEMEKNQ